MTDPDDIDATGSQEEDRRSEIRSNLGAYALSLVLTVPLFALVAWGDVGRETLGWIIAVSGLAQIVVHFRGFLHIRLKGQARDDLQLILFTTLVLLMMGGGTLWILHNLGHRM